MKTITFYSYKGGVGRTLLLANVAKYLASFGQRVFALDFDLEAPGLHHKFDLNKTIRTKVDKGIVDYIHTSLVENKKINSLESFVVQVDTKKKSKGKILFIPAGNVVSENYWQRLSKLNWHDLFYSEVANGIPFFLDLKARIQEEYKPDYLLIDARTGITEIGGVATTILPDYVVCLLLKNRENMEGAREVLRSISRTTYFRNQNPIEIIPVITRLPTKEGSEDEQSIIEEVKNYLNEESTDLADTLAVSDISILHRDKGIELEEAILVDSNNSIESSPLLRDYIRLISKIVPREVIDPNIDNLVKEALDFAWHDPQQAERDLVFLAERSVRAEPFQALLKFYRVRNESKDKLLRVAWKYWQVTYKSDDPLLWAVIKENFDWDTVKKAFGVMYYSGDVDKPFIDIDFIFRVWECAKDNDIGLSIEIARACSELKDNAKTLKVLQTLKYDKGISETNLIKLLRLSVSAHLFDFGFELINHFKSSYQSSPKFLDGWMDLIIGSSDSDRALEIINDSEVEQSSMIETDTSSAIKIYRMANKLEETKKPIQDWITKQLRSGSPGQTHEAGILALEIGFFEEYKSELLKRFPSNESERIIRDLESRRY